MMAWLKRREGARLAVLGLGAAAILFVAVNVFAGNALKGVQADLTETRLFTVAEGTRDTLGSLEEPIDVRLYFSKAMREAAPVYGAFFDRVHALLQQYRSLSNGMLRLTVLDPEPFSDAEDRAVADGLQGVPVTQSGELGYFGLSANNTTDGQAAIPFFNLEREPFLEYDITKLIYGLARPAKPLLAVVSSLPAEAHPGGTDMGAPSAIPPQLTVLTQLREFFSVIDVPWDAAEIPDNAQGLLVIDLAAVSKQTLRAVDRFVHAGKPAMILIDPVLESQRRPMVPPEATAEPEEVAKLLAAWGLTLQEAKVAADIDAGRQVSAGSMVVNYPVWLALPRGAVDQTDPVMAGVERLNLASAGILEARPDATTKVQPLIQTGPRAMAIEAPRVRFGPDFEGLLRDFKPGGSPLTLGVRVSGPARSAFAGEPATDAPRPVNLIVIADADWVYDRFWVQSGQFYGQSLAVPIANNGDLVLNSIENLMGAQSLAGLRGRGTAYRPFTLVEALRRDAELQFRAKEETLQTQLRDIEQRMAGVERQQDGQGQIVLSAADRQALEQFRGEMLTVRKQLRDVQLALRQDIEQVQFWVKAVNIAAVPLLLVITAVAVLFWRRHRATAARSKLS
jgi:ABC-type uncharacterized transport system involved in gliding motility auxiliary subunit